MKITNSESQISCYETSEEHNEFRSLVLIRRIRYDKRLKEIQRLRTILTNNPEHFLTGNRSQLQTDLVYEALRAEERSYEKHLKLLNELLQDIEYRATIVVFHSKSEFIDKKNTTEEESGAKP